MNQGTVREEFEKFATSEGRDYDLRPLPHRDEYYSCLTDGAWSAWRAAYAAGLAARVPDGWISVKDRLPECSLTPNTFGEQVQIYPPLKQLGHSDVHVAFYGCRQTDEPNFYIYGRVLDDVTHWASLLAAPKEPK